MFTKFLVETAKALTTIGARHEQLTDLIGNANHTFKAVGDQQNELREGLKELPETLHQGNMTFTELPPTLAALEELVITSKPTTKSLTTAAGTAAPAGQHRHPGGQKLRPQLQPPGQEQRPHRTGARRSRGWPRRSRAASPATVQSLKESIPITAPFGPYSPDLAGTLRSFGQVGLLL